MEQVYEKPICERCGSKYTYVKINGDIICRSCGHINKANERRGKKKNE